MALRIVALLGLLLVPSLLDAQEEPSARDLSANNDHLRAMANRASRLSMKYAGNLKQRVPQLLPHPVMRTANKEGNPDGSVWLWLDGQRPVAALCIWNRGPLWYSENCTLTDDALELSGWPKATWQSTGTPRKWTALDDVVPDSQAARQRVLRAISLRFTAREDRMGIKSELRLLPRPLHTYSDADHGTLDGALFAFAYGTDPELFMQIEARDEGGVKTWKVAFARLASAQLSVQHLEQEIWSVPAISKETVTAPNADYCIVREDS